MKIILMLLAAIILVAIVSAVVCSTSIKTTQYTVSMKNLESPSRIVCISDLHSKEYGNDNCRLVDLISEQKPDAIFMVGDMLSRKADDEDIENFVALIVELSKVAPVYYTFGNHENEFYEARMDDVAIKVTEAGGVVLNNEYADVQIGGNKVRLVGLLGDNEPWLDYYNDKTKIPENTDNYSFLGDLRECQLPTIWMAHQPNMMIFFEPYEEYRMDLVLSGHVHGGVWRIPGIGGVISPSEGIFPEYDKGEYKFEDTEFILSGGLSGYDWVPRVFNLPEICVITMIPS